MATSGSSNWTQTRDNMIQQILEKVGAIEIGASPTAEQIVNASTELNQFMKWLQVVHDVKLWKLEWAQKIFSSPSEVTGTDSEVYTCILSHTSSADTKPITGDNWTTYWKKKGSTGGTWVTSTAYTSAGDFTDSSDLIAIENAYIRKNNTDTEVEVIGNNEYASISNKIDFGDPIRIHFDNKLSPTIYVYPQVEDVDDVVLHYQKVMRIEDVDSAADNPDFPVHWIAPIVWNVVHDLGMGTYKLPIGELREIKRKADEYLTGILFSTREHSQVMRISPRRRR